MVRKNAKSSAKTSLTERAMLVRVSIGYWTGRKKDGQASEEVAKEKNAARDAGTWWTRLMPKSAISPVQNAVMAGRVLNNNLTLPWMDGGVRVLPAEMFFDYSKQMREAEEKFDAAVKEFCDKYTERLADARERLGDLYKPEMFPTAREIKSKFHWSVNYLPLPDSKDFRVDLGAETTKAIQQDIEAQTQTALEASMRDLWDRLYKVIGKVAERLSDPKNIFRDSLIGNVTELCDLLPHLNVMGDEKLEDMRQQVLKTITSQKPDELRVNETERDKTAKAAKSILDTMGQFMGKKES